MKTSEEFKDISKKAKKILSNLGRQKKITDAEIDIALQQTFKLRKLLKAEEEKTAKESQKLKLNEFDIRRQFYVSN